MVAAVRSGQSQRAVARQFGVSLATVQLWVKKAQSKAWEQVDWEGGSHAPHEPPGKTSEPLQQRVLQLRLLLAQHSDLGEFGAQAIRNHLLEQPDLRVWQVPSVATINRILRRHGLFDARRRVRRKPPAPGWYLPEVAARRAEIDETDCVEGLYLEGGQEVCLLNLISLHGGWCASWLHPTLHAPFVRACLVAHWRAFGLPDYAQFDNGNVFTGPRQHPDAIGTVIRLCLSLGVTPVFAVPREFGIQSAIESYNNLWQQKVWQRFHFESLEQAQHRWDRYVGAVRTKRGARQEAAPPRRGFPAEWTEPVRLCRQGQILFLRRTSGQGVVELLGHQYPVDAHWCHRLVRCEVDLCQDQVRVYGLRRQAPEEQRLLKEWAYRLPDKSRIRSQQRE
jgi:hypothetical protein